MSLKVLLWDVDGTLAETERDGHLVAMNAAFDELRVPWRWTEERYGELLRVAGGYERLLHDMGSQLQAPQEPEARHELALRIHRRKNEIYTSLVRTGAIPLRAGVRDLMEDCAVAEMPMAIVTTTSRANVAALLVTHLGVDWERRFATVVTADEAPLKKPDSQACRMALEQLGISGPAAVAIEDSPAGLAAANAVHIPVIIARSRYFDRDDVTGALAVGPDLGSAADWTPPAGCGSGRIDLSAIRLWHEASARHCGG